MNASISHNLKPLWNALTFSLNFLIETRGETVSQKIVDKEVEEEEIRGTEAAKTEVKIPLGDGEEVS